MIIEYGQSTDLLNQLKISPYVPISDEICKWVVLAYIRAADEVGGEE